MNFNEHEPSDELFVDDEELLEGSGELSVQVGDEPPIHSDFKFTLPLVPGSDANDDVEVEDELDTKDDSDVVSEDDAELETSPAQADPWNWAATGLSAFMKSLHEILQNIPPHSGYDTSGIERAVSYLEAADKEISKAVRMDLKGELDTSEVEKVRKEIRDGIKRLQDRNKSLNKESYSNNNVLVKQAQKISGVDKLVVTVPLLISRLARICINGYVSGGHDLNDMFHKLSKKYNLTKREEAELSQLIFDMGYALRQDRGFDVGEEYDTSSSDNFDYMANYPA